MIVLKDEDFWYSKMFLLPIPIKSRAYSDMLHCIQIITNIPVKSQCR